MDYPTLFVLCRLCSIPVDTTLPLTLAVSPEDEPQHFGLIVSERTTRRTSKARLHKFPYTSWHQIWWLFSF